MTNSTLEARLREHYSSLADEVILSDLTFNDLLLPGPTSAAVASRHRRSALFAAAAVALLGVAGAIVVAQSRSKNDTPPAATNEPVATSAPINTSPPTTTEAAGTIERRPEAMPYVLDDPRLGAPNDGMGYVDPPTGAIGRTFLSDDAELAQILVVLTFPLDSAQPPNFDGDVVEVPAGTARTNTTSIAGQSTFQWDLPDVTLLVRGIGMSMNQLTAAAIQYQRDGTVEGMQLDSVWGMDRDETDRDYYVADDPTSSPWSLRFTWSVPAMGWPSGPAAQHTTVLGQPALSWTTGLDNGDDVTSVAWQVPGSHRWMQLITATDTLDAALAALRPAPETTDREPIGYLSIPALDGAAFVLDGIAGERLEQLPNANAVHDRTTTAPSDSDTGLSIIHVGSEQFGTLEALPTGTEVDWKPTGQPAVTFTVQDVSTLTANDDSRTLTDRGLLIVSTDQASGQQTIVRATRAPQDPSTTEP